MKLKTTLLALAAICVLKTQAQIVLSQDFNSASGAAGWTKINNSSPTGLTGWFMGNPLIFAAYNGADSAYFAANYNNTTGSTGVISNWLISPTVTLNNGGVFQFATRTNTAPAGQTAPDRLELYMGTGAATIPTGTNSMGTFTTLLVTVNPSLTTTGYPTNWTVYTTTLSGLTGTLAGRFAFRYFVTSAGPTGTNSSYVGIDGVRYTLPCPNPTLTVTSSTNNICSGNVVTFSATGATTYTWANNGLTTPTIAVSPTATTIYTVTGSSTPNCNTTETIAVTVTLTPNLSVADVTTCAGTAATLVATGATTYSWETGATSNSIVVTPTANTTYSVTGYNGICESTHYVSVALGVSLSVNASASQGSLCSGGSVSLTSTGASSYTWSPGGSGQNITVTPSATTVYTVTGASGACTGMQTVSVNVSPSPNLTITGTPTLSANNITTCPQNILTFTATGASSYSWASTSNFTNVHAITTASVPGSSSYTVVGTATNNCVSKAVVTVSVNACTGIESIEPGQASVSVYPNPFGNELKIINVSGSVEVYNALGQLVLKQTVKEQASLATEGLAKGVYVLKAYNEQHRLVNTTRLLKN